MRALYSPMSVGDYCAALNDDSIIVNDEYQRNTGLWSSHARSFFIESILLEYPIPKIFLYAKVDLATRTTIKEIVDGQQRSHALQNFYNRRFKLSAKIETEELRGKNYNQLPGEYQTAFLSYSLPIDEFRGVLPLDIQESFRRMNASNVPLNDEEQRNARFQGAFKWFVQGISDNYHESFRRIGLFSRRDIIRMADTKLIAEIVHTIENGFITTKATQLDALYRKHNASYPEEEYTRNYLANAMEQIIDNSQWHERELMRSYMFYTLALVLIDRRNQFNLAARACEAAPEAAADVAQNQYDLADLLNALREPDESPQLAEFVSATKGTNVGKAKATRFLYLNAAI